MVQRRAGVSPARPHHDDRPGAGYQWRGLPAFAGISQIHIDDNAMVPTPEF
jgi:hypothetical protein